MGIWTGWVEMSMGNEPAPRGYLNSTGCGEDAHGRRVYPSRSMAKVKGSWYVCPQTRAEPLLSHQGGQDMVIAAGLAK